MTTRTSSPAEPRPAPAPSARPSGEHHYLVTYDIRDPKRWRRVFRLMQGFGEWVQLSVFQCRLSASRHAELHARLDALIHHGDDHVLIVDMGSADRIRPRLTSLGKGFEAVRRAPIIV
jgi:CRISPR-associated protein Cas2